MVTTGTALIRDFVNTRNVEDGLERLDSPARLRAWLAEHELLTPRSRVSSSELERARELREALRALLRANNGLAAEAEAARVLDRAALRAGVALRFGDGTARLEPSRRSGVDRALGLLLVRVAESMADGSWPRLKACRADDCRWVYYDETRNRSRRWCAMTVCGNRAKARTFRRRHAA
jgi:predicted RNA-binding Zn ribbon-like protein